MLFKNRREAGRLLGRKLGGAADWPGAVVLAIPRGGAPVAYEVARAIRRPLDVFVVRRVAVPGRPELTLGAVTSGGASVVLRNGGNGIRHDDGELRALFAEEHAEVERRERVIRAGRPGVRLPGRTVLVVDDGLTPGATLLAVAEALRTLRPLRAVFALPAVPPGLHAHLAPLVDDLVCAFEPAMLGAGLSYEELAPSTDIAVRELLGRSARERAGAFAPMSR